MAMDWNPHLPDTVGLEWFPTEQGEYPLVAGAAAALRFDSTVVETIDRLEVLLPVRSEQATRVLAEVYAAGSEVPTGDITTTTYRPNSDMLNQADAWIRGTTSVGLGSIGTTNLYQRIDEATLSADDWIAYNGTEAGRKVYRASFNAGAWGANRRIVGGRQVFVVDREDRGGRFDVFFFDGTSDHYLGTVNVTTKRRRVTVPWPEYNPSTNLPWTQADIQDLGTSGTSGLQIRPKGVGRNKSMRVYQWYLELDWLTENRQAVGSVLAGPANPDTPAVFELRHPTSGASNWNKTGGTVTVLLRRIAGSGVARWRWLEETAAVAAFLRRPDANTAVPVETFHPTLDTKGFVSRLGDPIPGRALAFILRQPDGDVSVDGQPYTAAVTQTTAFDTIHLDVRTGAAGDFAVIRWVGALADVTIDVTTTADVPVASIALTAAEAAELGVPAGRSSYDFVFNPADADNPAGSEIWVFEATLPVDFALAAATVYRIHFSPGYRVVALTALETEPSYDGGGTDGPATLSTLPEGPEDLAAVVTTVPVAEGLACGPAASIDVVDLGYTPTGLGGDFDRYEVERNGYVFSKPTAEAVAELRDLEPPRNVTSTYRIRVIRAGDFLASRWSDPVTATPETIDAEVIIASNAAGAAVAYQREPDYEGTFPSNDEVVELSGVDGRTVLYEAEDRLEEFPLPLILFAGDDATAATPDLEGRWVVEPLRAFLRAGVPYFAVCDADGWVWYGYVRLVRWRRAEPASVYLAEVEVVELTRTPPPFDPAA